MILLKVRRKVKLACKGLSSGKFIAGARVELAFAGYEPDEAPFLNPAC
jgi:hypothetical protein